ncbi:MAG: radical SAM protein [Methanobacteriota archaeon]
MKKESPDYVRTSLAAAMTLGFKDGLFYRNARLFCINLLLTYDSGCSGNCAYCGLSQRRAGSYGEKSFIRVVWPIYKVTDVTERIFHHKEKIKRICLSMITHKKAIADTSQITRTLTQTIDIPLSLLISPTTLKKDALQRFKNDGANRIGIAIDAATPELFRKMRGPGVRGPHTWERYWGCFEEAIEIFGKRKVGAHLIVGLGETEKEMITTIQKVYDLGGTTHLFSFFPEKESLLSHHPQPPIGQFRRVQLARFLIDEGRSRAEDFGFDASERLRDFSLTDKNLLSIIDSGKPFMTSGCPGDDGEVSCNRPYADCLPGEEIRSFPFIPERKDILKIKEELWSYQSPVG